MKIYSAILFLLLLSSCKKIVENTKRNPAPDFELRLTKIETNGNTIQQVDNAVNMIDAVTAAASYSFKNKTVEIEMGIQPVTTVTPRLKASVHIFNCDKVADAVGVYLLPSDASKLQLICTETSGTGSIIMSNPFEGKIEIKYDAVTNTLNGVLTGFRFTPTTSSVQSLLLNGKFNHAAIRN